MNLREAYAVLEIPETSTPDEAKKKYRELTKKYHPDINKDEDSTEKIKKINEAYQVVSSGKSTDRQDTQWKTTHNPFNPFGNVVSQSYVAETIELHETLSFKESVFGCKRDIKFNRRTKCTNCNGSGEIKLHNGCEKCGGRGQVVGRQGNMVVVTTCDKCYGKSKIEPCTDCKHSGVLDVETSINVSIPGGVLNGNTLRLGNMGHFVGNFGPIDQYTDAHLHIQVIPESGLMLDGTSVVCTLQIPLVDALQGCHKMVKTILGDRQIDVNPKSRNRDEVIIPHLGVNSKGDQRVILDVIYPEDTEKLISLLNERTS